MVYVVITVKFPYHKTDEVIKLQAELNEKDPLPEVEYMTMICPGAVKSTKKGVKIIYISEVKKGNLEKALTYNAKNLVRFRNIKGFIYQIEVYNTIVESTDIMAG